MAIKSWDTRLAQLLVKPLVNTPVHPNHLTGLSFLFGLAAAVLFVLGGTVQVNVAAGLFIIAVFLDHTDGELARRAGKSSSFGQRFDSAVNASNYTMLFISIGIGLSDGPLGNWALLLGFAAGLSNPIILFLRIRTETRHGSKAVAHPRYAGFEIEDMVYLIGPITWFVGLEYFFLAYGIGSFGYFIWTIWEALKPRASTADS
ncbi:MAG: CDP-alcohol phosphatidyltransferase family protein [Alphaproteobacteria bacterium]|nr:CDP-alcohol phosphatidyltransferase family protein [Alphaproteobacteria bacterium]